MYKKIFCALCFILIVSIICGCSSKNPVAPNFSKPSVSSTSKPANNDTICTNDTTTTTSSNTTCSSGTSTGVTSVNSNIFVYSGGSGTDVTSIDFSTGVNSIGGGSSTSSTGSTINTGTTTSTTTIGGTMNVTVKAAGSLAATLTINSGSTPKFAWSYSGVSGNSVEIEVYSTSTYWDVTFSSSTQNATYGVTPSGGTVHTQAKTLTKGNYTVFISLFNNSILVGWGMGTLTVQ